MATVNLGPYKLKVKKKKPAPTPAARNLAGTRQRAKGWQQRANKAYDRGDGGKGFRLDATARKTRRAVRTLEALNQRDFQRRVGGLVANPKVRHVVSRRVGITPVTPAVHLDLDSKPPITPKPRRDLTTRKKKLRLI